MMQQGDVKSRDVVVVPGADPGNSETRCLQPSG